MSEQEDPGLLRSTFDSVASLYDEARPGYPERLFDDLAALSGTGPGAKALEIGCGTGQATVPLARRGYRVLCVELGANLAAIARSKPTGYPDARVLASSFEGWPLEEEAFDLVVSATAFHWVGSAVRYQKSAQALRPGGSLALIWNTHHPEGSTEGFPDALDDLHRRETPHLAHTNEGRHAWTGQTTRRARWRARVSSRSPRSGPIPSGHPTMPRATCGC